MFGLGSGRLDPLSSDFDRHHLDEALTAVKSNVRRRRALTRLPVVVLSGFGALLWFSLFQGSTLSSSAPVEVVAQSTSGDGVAVGGDGGAQSDSGQSDAVSADEGGITYEQYSDSAIGGIESQDASLIDGDSAVPPRPVPVFDISTVIQDQTQAGPSSPPPAVEHPLLAPGVEIVGDDSSNGTAPSPPVGDGEGSREDEPFGELDTFAASPELSTNAGNPSISNESSGEGANSGEESPVRIELAEGSTIDPENPLHLTLRLRVIDPTGATAGSCGSSVNWSDGSSSGNMCEVGCSTDGGDGVDEILTFDHTYAEPGVAQVLVTMYTGEDCYGSRGSLLLSIQVGDDPSSIDD